MLPSQQNNKQTEKEKATNSFESPIGGGYITIKTPLEISTLFAENPGIYFVP